MSKLNIFIDGTWLFYQCGAGQSLSNATELPNRRFPLDFAKLKQALLQHVKQYGGNCDEVGDCYLVTSIFQLPADFDDWPNQFDDITTGQIERTKNSVHARDSFAQDALSAGYLPEAIFRPPVRDYIVRRLSRHFQYLSWCIVPWSVL